MRILCLTIILFLSLPAAKAQYLLHLKNKKNGKVYERYYPGHTIDFYTKDLPDEIEGIIDSIGDHVFYVRNIPYPDSVVSVILIKPQGCNWRINGAKLMIAGLIYPGVELFNNEKVNGKFAVRGSSVIIGAVLFTTGYLLYHADRYVYFIGRKYSFKTI